VRIVTTGVTDTVTVASIEAVVVTVTAWGVVPPPTVTVTVAMLVASGGVVSMPGTRSLDY
jgi:hypothetical protein